MVAYPVIFETNNNNVGTAGRVKVEAAKTKERFGQRLPPSLKSLVRKRCLASSQYCNLTPNISLSSVGAFCSLYNMVLQERCLLSFISVVCAPGSKEQWFYKEEEGMVLRIITFEGGFLLFQN